MTRGAKIALGAAAIAGAGPAKERLSPSACPYSQRWMLEVPRPGLSVARLCELLEPRAGERVLEVGPGTGFYALPVAERVAPQGTLLGLDLHRRCSTTWPGARTAGGSGTWN